VPDAPDPRGFLAGVLARTHAHTFHVQMDTGPEDDNCEGCEKNPTCCYFSWTEADGIEHESRLCRECLDLQYETPQLVAALLAVLDVCDTADGAPSPPAPDAQPVSMTRVLRAVIANALTAKAPR
jgi:hypothetical protein